MNYVKNYFLLLAKSLHFPEKEDKDENENDNENKETANDVDSTTTMEEL